MNDSDMFYRKIVMGLVTCSITEFSRHNTPRIGQFLPDIWVDGRKLYQYQTLYNGEGQRYVLVYHKLLDPYQYAEDNISVITTLLAPW